MSKALNVVAGFVFATVVVACSAGGPSSTPASGAAHTAPSAIAGKTKLQATLADARPQAHTRS